MQVAVIPQNCKYLLQNCELSYYQEYHRELFEQLFELLQTISGESVEQIKWVFQLYKKSSKKVILPAVVSESAARDKINVIPNMFNILDCEKTFNELVDWLGESREVTNLPGGLRR